MDTHPYVVLPLVRLHFPFTALTFPFVSLFALWRWQASFVSRVRGLFVRVPFDSTLDFIHRLLCCLP